MKKFSEIRSVIRDRGMVGERYIEPTENDLDESIGVGMQPQPSVDDTEFGSLLDLSDDRALDQLNAFVGSISYRAYIDPVTAVQNLQNKLQMVGIRFDYNMRENAKGPPMTVLPTEGDIEFPLYRFGVVSGYSKKFDGSFVNNLKTMGEESKTEYCLCMNFNRQMNGLTEIKAKVVRKENN
jgi:hypothetical protein